jgi:RimJ/RimL family protein N-acetyltransferase
MIEGKLVNLRSLETTDIDKIYAWVNDGEVMRHLNGRYPFSRAYEEAWLAERTAGPLSFDNARFAVETKDGVGIGTVTFHTVHTENRKARLGIMIGDKAYWSKGYGTDTMMTMLRFGFDQMNLHRIDLTVDEDNPRAIACYRKCGFVEEGRLRQLQYREGRYIDQFVMGILRDEFYSKHGVARSGAEPEK